MSKIMMVVATRDVVKYPWFYDYFHLLHKPDGSVAAFVHAASPAAARNTLITAALEHDCTHIFFIDDDMELKPDTLERLMAHNKDVVGGFYLMHHYPHQGLTFTGEEKDGQALWHNVSTERGLLEVSHTGLGCVLFNLDVFKALEKPWVRLGQIKKDEWCDDVDLYNRVRAAGFKIYVDVDTPVGHMGEVIVRPSYRDGRWHVEYDTRGPQCVAFPMVVEEGK